MEGNIQRLAGQLHIEIPSDDQLAVLWQREILDQPRVRAMYTDELPSVAELLVRRKVDYQTCITTWEQEGRRIPIAIHAAHDVQAYSGLSPLRSGWTCGCILKSGRGPDNADLRIAQMAVVTERFFMGIMGITHFFAAVITSNRPGNDWARNIGFTYVGTMRDFLPVNGVLVDHNIYAWDRAHAILGWHAANLRNRNGWQRLPEQWENEP